MPVTDVNSLVQWYQSIGWVPKVPLAAAEQRLLARLTEFVNVSDYGADPTGVLDSTTAFNNAIAALGTNSALVIPAGSFSIGAALSAIPANCTVIGSGEYSTTLSTNQGSGTFMSATGANATVSNLLITNTNTSNTCAALSLAANQLTVLNVSITGFGSTSGCLSMTSAATFGGLFNVFISSSVSGAVGMQVAGADTSISGCVFSGLATGMLCNANDRFSVVDNIYKTCTTGISITNTSSSGSTTFGGLQFDGCTTGVSIAPGTSQAAQAITFDACVFDNNTTAASIAPTSTGTVTYVDFDGCDMISNVASANGIVINGAGASSVQYVTVDGCDIVCSGTGATGFTYTSGGTASAPISFVNCDMNSTTNVSPAVGSANNLPFVFRACPGVNPVGKLSSQPTTASSAVTNNTGCDVMVSLVIGGTATTVSIGGANIFAGTVTALSLPLRVPYNQTITTSQTTAVSWIWFGD